MRTPLYIAIKAGNVKVARLLIEAGADIAISDINIKDINNYKRTLLHVSVVYDRADMVRLLIEIGADINAKDILSGSTPLSQAKRSDRTDIVNILIEAGATE